MLTQPILCVRNLTMRFGSFRAVDNVSMGIPRAAISLLIGPNGSGKTTLVNCISGLYTPEEGTVKYMGADITGEPPHKIVKKGLVRTFQIAQPFLRLTVLENLLVSHGDNPGESVFWSFVQARWAKQETTALEKAHKVLELLELEDLYEAAAGTLSGGQLKLLEIGRALMTDAKTIVMDEPAGSVSPVLAHTIFSHIQRLRDQLGLTFLLVEHRLDVAAEYVDRVCAMARGRVICEGAPKEVFNNPEVIESYLGG